MSERRIHDDYELRGLTFGLWIEDGNWWLVLAPDDQLDSLLPRNTVLSEDDFTPPLTEKELRGVWEYIWDWGVSWSEP